MEKMSGPVEGEDQTWSSVSLGSDTYTTLYTTTNVEFRGLSRHRSAASQSSRALHFGERRGENERGQERKGEEGREINVVFH